MNKKLAFINFVKELLDKNPEIKMSADAASYWAALQITDDVKSQNKFTDNGKLILRFLQEHIELELVKAKDIAEGLGISSRTVSGAMRKLVTDGYVEKIGQNPVIYVITEKGKEIEIDKI